ncbi:metal resistance protein YCF1 [Basidiobolus meristosporus CBS 931.73]|uniref:Metal resistance protein YCF1 n=1 Tax=Basidiobolus meristosporus CBS 931.73 TaxID=1314790 RepID=A0A1Y1Z322_9FUNG|nr:metal resistance protein YCF1 [Basidiobolus meristosporus CBS 931.73]|eukprot:ORY04586.1 metal resistance protein YCF1 [Basidiobolus meristosporus CBS 931.73]
MDTFLSTGWLTCSDPEGWGPWSFRTIDFTLCFEYGVVLLVPTLFLFVFGIPRLQRLRQKIELPQDSLIEIHYWAKMITLLAIFGLNIALDVTIALKLKDTWSTWWSEISFVSNLVVILSMFLIFTLHRLEHTRSRKASSVLLLYWLFKLGANVIYLRTLIVSDYRLKHPTEFIFIATVASLEALIFILELIPKHKLDYLLPGEEANVCPEQYANVFSLITFSWMNPLLMAGSKKPLVEEDLWSLEDEYKARQISDQFQDVWQHELSQEKKEPSLVWTLAKSFGLPFLCGAFFKVLQDILAFVQPQLLKQLMGFVGSQSTDDPEPAYRGYSIAGAMFLTAIVQTIFLHQYFQRSTVTGMKLRCALVTAIYRKALVLSNTARQNYTVGEIVNHMTVDAQRVQDLCMYGNIAWSGPFQIALSLYFLYQTLGPSIFAGVGIMVLSIPLNGLLARKMQALQKAQMKNKDARIKLTDELLNGIKVIKLYAWEKSFLSRIFHVRNDQEIETLKKYGYTSAIQNFFTICVPFLVSLSTFGIYTLVGDNDPLTPDLVFVALSLFNLLQFPLTMFPHVISALVEASVAFGRLYKFLTSEELDSEAVQRIAYSRDTRLGRVDEESTDLDDEQGRKKPMVQIRHGTFRWDKNSPSSTLSNIDLSCKKGELLAIVGRVGSGKSSLVSSLLGEMEKSPASNILIRGKVAYAPQQPWIMNATVKENILFGHRYDEQFYQETIKACALVSDLEMLPGGDMTEIGEKGINLSGGQKARISLARAVYARADVYLLDDPLSAVDAHVGRHIFDHVIGPKGLLRTKARIFVTHAIAYIKDANQVIMLRDGQIIEKGGFRELMDKKNELYNLISEFARDQSLEEPAEQDPELVIGSLNSAKSIEAYIDGNNSQLRRMGTKDSAYTLRRASVVSEHDDEEHALGKSGLMTVEESAKGSVSWKVYKDFAKSCSIPTVLIYLLLLVCVNMFQVGSNLWLKWWTSQNVNAEASMGVWGFLAVYSGLGIAASTCTLLQSIMLWVVCAVRSARVTHTNMLLSVIRSPMSFFDTTPLGRVLNRFSKDQYTLDEVLPQSFNGYFRTSLNVVAVMTVITFSTPGFLIVVAPILVLYIIIQRYYLNTSRELKRLESISRSPTYAHFQETIGGVSSIRAYGQEKRFIRENEFRLDKNLMAYYPSLSLNRWLAVRLEFLGSIIIFTASILAVISVLTNGKIDAGLVGLSITYALNVTQSLNWCIRMSCEIETNIVSMERIKEYSELPSEAPEINEATRPSPTWPEQGQIEFRDLALRYRAGLDLVLKGISFTVNPHEKIGIVGRTGAGKSSLTLSLFRLVEPASGSIIIDGVDITKIGLYDLRSRLTIIPQDPFLFAGTVRENLDPFGNHEDLEIWNVLGLSHLKDHVSSLEGKLNATVLQGGENFSVGQRQLICLARALLRRTSVLILDEATAAIDVETDRLIQETIRREFVHCSVLTIAHRINTVLDSDRVLVLDQGKIVEFDSPKTLLNDSSSKFYGLAKEAAATPTNASK